MRRLLKAPILAVAIIFALLWPHFACASDQWPMYQGNPSHTGFIGVSLDPTKFALRWVRNFDYQLSPAAAAGGRVFLCSDQSLYALDSSSGQNVWSTDFGSFFVSNHAVSAASPAYSDGKIYIQIASIEDGAFLCAYDAATGTLVFKSNAGPGDSTETFYAPTIFERKVYIQGTWHYGYIYSFDGSSGNVDWTFTQSSDVGPPTTPAIDENWAYRYSGYCPPGINSSCYNILYVADRLTGQLVFQIADPAPSGLESYMPVLGGLSDLFVIAGDQLIRFDLNARNISWVNSGTFMYQPAVANGIVYAINNGIVGAYDQATGTLQWAWETPITDGGAQGTIIVTNSHLFVTSTFNTYCIDLNTHKAVWSYPAAGDLSLGESTLYISCWDGTLTAISLGIPDIYVPETVDFGSADLGETVTRTIPVSNVGDAPLEVQSVLPSSEEFVVQSLALPITIGPHQSVPIDVQFTPVAGGPGSANLLVSSTDPDEPSTTAALKVRHTITASSNAGGQISPSGTNSVLDEDSSSFVIAPNPGYQLASLILDGVNVANPSTSAVTYTFDNVTTDHTITAVFAHYFDYFGIQAGNHFESTVTSGRSIQTQTDDISLDTTSFAQPSFLDLEVLGGTTYHGWYQILSNGIFTPEISSMGLTMTLNPPLPMIETPLAPGKNWKGSSNVEIDGVTATFTAAGKVPAKAPVIVTVPSGTFLAWPVTYTLTGSARGRALPSQTFTEWFAPYIGTVYSVESGVTTKLTSFAVGAGTVSYPPPVVTGTSPVSALPGSQITVNGYQFGASQESSVVKIGSLDCAVVSWSDRQIQCTVPDAASSGAVTVITDTWTSNGTVQFMILPQITNVAPSSGKRGSSVVITGTNFGTIKGKVKFGNAQAKITQWGDTSITCTVPAAPYGTCAVEVLDSAGQSIFPGAFTVVK